MLKSCKTQWFPASVMLAHAPRCSRDFGVNGKFRILIYIDSCIYFYSIYLFICLFVCLFIFWFTYLLFIYLFIYLFIHLFIYMYVCMYIYICVCIYHICVCGFGPNIHRLRVTLVATCGCSSPRAHVLT